MKNAFAACTLLLASTAAFGAAQEPVAFAGSVWDGDREVSRFDVRVQPGSTARLDIGDGRVVEMEVPGEGAVAASIRMLDAAGKQLHSSSTEETRDYSVRYVVCAGRFSFISPEPTTPSACPATP